MRQSCDFVSFSGPGGYASRNCANESTHSRSAWVVRQSNTMVLRTRELEL